MVTIKAVISDFDGTLFSHTQKCIPQSTKAAEEELRRLGIPVYIATGRTLESVEKTLGVCGQSRNLCPGVYHDGSVYYDSVGQPHMIASLNEQLCRKIVDLLMAGRSGGLQINISIQGLKWLYLLDEGCFDKGRQLALEYMGTDYRCASSIDDILYGFRDHLMCLMISSDSEAAVLASQKVLQMAIPDLPDFIGGHPSIAVLNNGTHKVEGVKALCRALALNFDEIVVIGDGDNDISMLSFFPHSIAMGNGCEESRLAAKIVAPTCDDDGWANGVLNYICHLLPPKETILEH